MGSKPSSVQDKQSHQQFEIQLEDTDKFELHDGLSETDEDHDENEDSGEGDDETEANTSRDYMEVLNASVDFSQSQIISKTRTLAKVHDVLKIKRREDLKTICHVMIENGILSIFNRMWDIFHSNKEEFYSNIKSVKFRMLKMLKVLLVSYSDKCPELAEAIFQDKEVVMRIMKELTFTELSVERIKKSKRTRYVIHYDFAILINVLRHCDKNKALIREDGGIEKVLKYSESTLLMIKAKAYIILAYSVTEEESDKITTTHGVIKFLVKILSSASTRASHVSRKYRFSVEETLIALNKLGSSDQNKVHIVDAGVLPQFNRLLQDKENTSKEERYQVVNCLWTLAFNKQNRQKIISEPGLIDQLTSLQKESEKSHDKRVNEACNSTLFVLEVQNVPDEVNNKAHKGNSKHIMISYNWEVQPTMLKLRDFLKDNGCDVWIDVDKMQESILEAMAGAVENSSLILVAMTESYKNSNPCRTEAEYAYRRTVPILPLLLQHGYEADGWLGAMVGTKLYVDLSSPYFENKFDEVRTQIEKMLTSTRNNKVTAVRKGVVTADARNPHDARNGLFVTGNSISCREWTKQDVQEWYKSIEVSDTKLLPKINGKSLEQLCKMLMRSPDSYYTLLRDSICLNVEDSLMFTDALESLILQSV